jgi:Flp pilus assembly protein TadG
MTRRSLSIWTRFADKARQDQRGIAAVEFALILPFMVMLYLGIVELSKGYMASQRMTLVARTLADLTAQLAQQPTTNCGSSGSTTVNLTDLCMSDVFGAASAIMAPFMIKTPAGAPLLTMTVSQIKLTYKADGTCCQAKTDWTIVNNGGTARPCQVLTAANAKPVSITTIPVGFTAPPAPAPPNPNYVVVADVTYKYLPGFGWDPDKWTDKSVFFPMAQTQYMRPRGSNTLHYAAGSGAQCS